MHQPDILWSATVASVHLSVHRVDQQLLVIHENVEMGFTSCDRFTTEGQAYRVYLALLAAVVAAEQARIVAEPA